MSLDSSLCDLDGGRRFELAKLPANARSWGIHIAEGNQEGAASGDGAAQTDPVAIVSITDERQIGFQWSSGSYRAQAEQLRNAVLRLTYDQDLHAVAFREPRGETPIRLDLNKDSIEFAIDIDTPPIREKTYCELVSLDNLDSGSAKQKAPSRTMAQEARQGVIVEPADKILRLGQGGQIVMPPDLALDLMFETNKESQMQLRLKPRYHAKQGDKTWAAFNYGDFKKKLQSMLNEINRNLRDLQGHVANYQANMRDLPQAQADYNQAMRGNVDPARATAATSRLQNMQRVIQKSESGIKRLSGSLPKSYEALGRLYELAVLSEQVQQAGQIQFRVVAEGEAGRVVLMAYQAEPPALPGEIVLEGFSMNPSGSWLRTGQPMLVYELAAGSRCTVTNPFQGKGVAGQWTEENRHVTVTAGSIAEQYDLVSPFQLRGVNMSLYRMQ
jgi:hypothetical protein